MKRGILVFAYLFFSMTVAFGQNEIDSVRQCFENYKKAVLEGRGEEAIKYVDSRTLRYYEAEFNLAVIGDSVTIEQLGLIDKLTVLMVRHRVPKDSLLALNGNTFFIYAVNNGLIGKNSVQTTEIGEVKIQNDFATGRMIMNAQQSQLYFQFNKEGDRWKIDLTSLFPPTNAALTKIIRDARVNDNEFIYQTLEDLTGRPVTYEIWKPRK